MDCELNNWCEIGGAVLPVFLLDGQLFHGHLVSTHVIGIDIDDDTGTEAQFQRVDSQRTFVVGTSWTQLRSVVHLDAAEHTAVGIQLGKAVQPEG